MFTAAELDFLRSQRIGRLATVGPSGWPHVVPVMYTMNDDGSPGRMQLRFRLTELLELAHVCDPDSFASDLGRMGRISP